MKVFNFFIEVLCILALLTVGSLVMIVTLRILPMEYALIKVQDLYESNLERLRLGIAGLLFILVGLALAKNIVKKTRADEEFFVDSDQGHVMVSFQVINELVQRSLKKFDVVRKGSVSSRYSNRKLKIQLALVIHSECNVTELLQNVKREIEERIQKTLGHPMAIDIETNLTKVEESSLEMAES